MSDFDFSMDFDFSGGLFDDPTSADGIELETARQLKRPLTHARRAAKREFISGLKREALNQLIPTLPPPDTDLYVVGNGAGAEIRHGINPLAFDFGSFIPHIVEQLGGANCTAYISTWTANANHVKTLIDMLDDGRLTALTMATDPYFKTREAAVCNQLITGILRHTPRARFLAWKNHCKIICIANADQTRFCTVTGSANLSAQPRTEQYVLTTAPDVYRFYVSEFFEVMFTNGS